ncbi:MAG: helix-hairpin-helix domain-containing protein [candidate division Zixibacteria bacterium]|nr:helix-hairpin-helix domain-containing protein [candidate division Zixibacteria bacterium]
MRFLNFTPQEIKALLFLLIALLVGSGITIYKRHHRSFAPELIFKESPSGSLEKQSQFNEDPNDSESYLQDTSREISRSYIASPISNSQNEKRSQDPDSGISSIYQNSLKKKIDLNSASPSDLELLPQIGPVLSQRIIDYRKTKGKFQKIEDLMKVSGIGPKIFERIKDFITVK